MGQQAKIPLPQAIFNGFLRVTVKVLNSYDIPENKNHFVFQQYSGFSCLFAAAAVQIHHRAESILQSLFYSHFYLQYLQNCI
ncbi:hypothetical protein [Clostridium sp. AF02-29]|uniref:hypothetical protein n=3 Tax=Clostridium sp. AF02-29 TaxID=2292993 RepID=UPI0023548A17|nr:hypothetical protein [Clostridium sp. AF02-29]